MGLEPRDRADQGKSEANPSGEGPGETPKLKGKSFEIDKRLVFRAWEKVRASYGAPGVDAVSIGQFQERERDNLYKLWNRMSSGSYFPRDRTMLARPERWTCTSVACGHVLSSTRLILGCSSTSGDWVSSSRIA